MEIKETDKIVVVKPVAWRPGLSNFISFSELLAGAVNVSPPAVFSETSVTAIKPRTVRCNPAHDNDLVGDEALGSAAFYLSDKVPESKVTSNVVYKPIPKLVSKTTVSLLANLGQGSFGTNLRRDVTEVGTHIQPSNEVNHPKDPMSDIQNKTAAPQYFEHNKKSQLLLDNRDRPAYDGHNWRKYGLKQVKGSEYLRSSCKCTYPNCPVKKKVETTVDGQIAEWAYKGEYDHPMPQSLKNTRLEAQVQISASDALQNEAERHDGHRARSERPNNVELSSQSTYSHSIPSINDPVIDVTYNASASTCNNGDCDELREAFEAEGGDFKSKRRKGGIQSVKTGKEEGATLEPHIAIQNNTDSEIIGDGFRWRKYGQKVVKGNAYPRSYYRCTSPKCNVKKYVERTSEGTDSFITTYEGKHDHAMPIRNTNKPRIAKCLHE